MVHKTVQMYKRSADHLLELANDPEHPISKADLKRQLEQLVHQVMLNEYGFNYELDMEFNDDLFKEYKNLQQLAARYAQSSGATC